jgi:hypothetical protein
MGIMSNTVSIYQYRVIGDVRGDEWALECLRGNRFTPIDTTPDQEAVGWVSFDDHTNPDFEHDGVFVRKPYYAFTLRRDQRKVPSALLKTLLIKECSRWLSERPDLSKVPFKRKAEMRDTLHASLLTKTLPVPSVYDVVWNTETGILSIASISEKVLDMVEDVFTQTFDGLSLEPIHPMSRAYRVIPDEKQQMLQKEDQAPSKDVLLQIKRNRWVGWDFLLWLMYQTSNGTSVYTINQKGPLEQDERFLSYLQDRIVLRAEHEEGVRKSSITGPQREFSEARSGIKDGKNIIEAIIHLEKESSSWKLALKADIFAFGSFTCPAVQIERDEITDPDQERIAVFYERMSLMETGLQIFDSVFSVFLQERIAADWTEKLKRINEWLSRP